MTKLRVNGKDFFTNNVSDFIGRLPARIIKNLQIINYYVEQSEFTGIKVTKPEKMLNVVLNDNINSGTFGDTEASGGSNDRYSGSINASYWRKSKQIGVSASSSNVSNTGGDTRNLGANLNYRTSFNENLTLSSYYSINQNKNTSVIESYVESVNEQGIIFNHNRVNSSSDSKNNSIDLNLQSNYKDKFISSGLRGTLVSSNDNNDISSVMTGLIERNTFTNNNQAIRIPNISSNLNLGRRLKKK